MSAPNQIPARWLTELFVWLCKPAEVDDLLGDMEEMYRQNLSAMSKRKATWKYLGQCLALAFSYTVKKRKMHSRFKHQQWSIQNIKSMYFNYLKMVFRRFGKRLSFSFINVFGLGVGLTASFLIVLYVSSEYSYDRFHKDHDRIYRLTKTYSAGGEEVTTVEMRNYFLPIIHAESPAVASYCRIKNQPGGVNMLDEGKVRPEEEVIFADANFFEFFTFPLISGNQENLLNAPYSAVISQSMAQRQFGFEDAIGQVIKVGFPKDGREIQLKVTGVFKDMPVNSHLHKDMVISASTGEAEAKAGRGFRAFVIQHNYFKLHEGQSIDVVNEMLPAIEKQHAPGFYQKLGMYLGTQPMDDIHLRSNLEREFEANGSEQYLDLLVILAGFIMVMVAFNYTNLATSQSRDRAKEVGVRKVMGSDRLQLTVRFMLEAIVNAFMGLLLATLLVALTLPYFQLFSGTRLVFDISTHWSLLAGFVGGTFLLGLLAGLYPAVYMSGFKPIASLKGKLSNTGKTIRILRRTLVTAQFSISAGLIIGAGLVMEQVKFMIHRDLGLNTEAVIQIGNQSREAKAAYGELKNSLLALPQVEAVAASTRGLSTNFDLRNTNGIYLPDSPEEYSMNYLQVDRDYFSLFEVPMLVGQTYDHFEGRPESGIILNRSAMERLGLNEQNAIGQPLKVYDGYHPSVIGVAEDFHFESLHEAIGPVYFQWVANDPSRFEVLSVKLTGGDLSAALSAVQEVYETHVKSAGLQYQFVEDRIAQSYQKEGYFLKSFGLFALLAVLIAGLGAFGQAMQLAVSKQKEMGVRKVMGASGLQLARLLSKELFWLVLLANFIAAPFTIWAMKGWLQGFAYSIDIGWVVLAYTLLLSLIVALLSTGTTLWKATLLNPTDSLRLE